MGRLVNLTRPDGTVFQATEEDAPQLVGLGYKPEAEEKLTERAVAASEERYYSSTSQKIKTGIEGLGSGLTLGGSDKLLEWATDEGLTGDEWRGRAEYNPGTRLATELVGAIAPAFFSGGTLTPAGALMGGAKVAGRGIKGTLARGAAIGGIEGAGFGLGAEISQSALTGDPLTVEGALAGIGWGAVFGGGLGAFGGAIEGRIARKAEVEAAIKAKEETTAALTSERWGALRDSVRDSAVKAETAFKTASDAVEMTSKSARETLIQANGIRSGVFNEPWTETIGMAKRDKKIAIDAFNDMKAAYKNKDWDGMSAAQERFNKQLGDLNKTREQFSYLGTSVEQINPIGRFAAQDAGKAMAELKDLAIVGQTLKSFAETPHGFVGMGKATFEKMSGAMEKFMAVPSAEFAGAQASLQKGIGELAEHVGVAVEGGPVAQLRATWETLRATKSAKGVEDATKVVSGGFGKRMAATAAGVATSKATGSGFLGFSVGRSIANGLLGVKGAILGQISSTAATWLPRAGKAAKVAGPKIEPMLTKLDGTQDSKKSAQEAFRERSKELREAAPAIRETLYKSLAPMDAHHPEWAREAHATAVKQFSWIYNKLPRDPGNSFSKLESLWNAAPIEVAKFGRYWEAFHNPTKVVNDALTKGHISPEHAEGIQNMWPALFQHLRSNFLERVMDPVIMAKMNYGDQIHAGLITGIPFHSTMTPQFIASQMQMYQERSTPLQMPPQPGAPGAAGGRPNADSPYQTQAAKSTNR